MNTFPTTLNNYTGSETLLAAEHAQEHNALEAKVGADGSAVTTSHDYKLSGVTGTDKAVSKTGTETLTNKTLTAPVLTAPVLGTPASGTLTNATGLPIATGVSGLGTGVATFLATPSSANLATAVTDETGSGALVFGTTPTLTTPVINGAVTGTALTDGYPITNSSMARQAIINGNFDVWQRGTSFTNPTTATYTADRFSLGIINTGTLPTNIVHSRQELTPGDIPGSFYYYRIAPDGAGSSIGASDLYELKQSIEYGTRYLCGLGKSVTVSFYARASVASKKLGVYAVQIYGTGGSPTSAEVINGSNFTLTSSWVKYTATITTNTLVGKTFGTANDDYLQLRFLVAWGDTTDARVGATGAETFGGSGTIDIAQVQLCAGDVALPFQPKSFVQELADCQRYCITYNTTGAYQTFGTGIANSTTTANVMIYFPVAMRVPPTEIVATAGDWWLWDSVNTTTVTSIALKTGHISNKNTLLELGVASGLTQYRPYYIIAQNSVGKTIIISAEL